LNIKRKVYLPGNNKKRTSKVRKNNNQDFLRAAFLSVLAARSALIFSSNGAVLLAACQINT